MNYSEDHLHNNEKESWTEKYFGLTTPKFIKVAAFVLAAGVYLGIIFFGDNSLSVLLDLYEHENYLAKDIEKLKVENASLQKTFFELQELSSTPSPEVQPQEASQEEKTN